VQLTVRGRAKTRTRLEFLERGPARDPAMRRQNYFSTRCILLGRIGVRNLGLACTA
jgi:hypothetical protein